jgi:UDP-GlcNAc:undecaprenyl-phosphate GlcNAc-1-phosphate transferase
VTLSVDAMLAIAGGAALLLAAILTPACRAFARTVGYVDRPGAHKSHGAVMPYGGGLAIALAGWAPLAALLIWLQYTPDEWILERFGETIRAYAGGVRENTQQAAVLLAGAAVLHILGIIDDLRPLGAYPKLVVMMMVAVAVPALSGARIAEFAGPVLSTALTAAWFIVIINSLNFLDNMDGLSAGVAAICLLMFGVCGRMAGQVFVPGLAFVWCGATLGFLIFNFPPARIFMGDAGSLLLGYSLAVTSTLTTYYESGGGAAPYALAMPLVVLAVPLYDFATVVTIRLREGRSPLRGDQRHFSHRLVDHGLTRRFAVVTIYICTLATGLAATLLPQATLRETVTLVAIVLLVLSIIAILERPARNEP